MAVETIEATPVQERFSAGPGREAGGHWRRLTGARARRLGFGAGAASLVVASLFGASAATGRGASSDAAAHGASPPAPTPAVSTAPPAPTEPPSEAAPTAGEGSKPRRVPSTTAPARRPVYVDGVPQVKATPGTAAVGARVRVEGYGFTDDRWSAPDAPLWLVHAGGCGLYAEAEHDLRVTPDGHLRGELTVPARGGCRQSDTGEQDVVAGRYRLAFSCTACFVGELRVTTPPPTRARCANVGFTPNSDDVASSIVARNVGCAEAEALVRRVGRPLGFNGPTTAAADGYRCVRTGREDEVLPQAFYECVNGRKRVTFTRT